MHPHEEEELDMQALYLGRCHQAVFSEFSAIELRAAMADELDVESMAIDAALEAGTFVVRARVARFGQYDEVLYFSTHFVAAYGTKEEAEAAAAELPAEYEYYHDVVGPVTARTVGPASTAAAAADATDADIPF